MDSQEPCSVSTFHLPEKGETKSGKFMRLQGEGILFRSKMPMFSLRFHTPFPVKGILTFRGNLAKIEGRIPLSTTVFLGAWFIGWLSLPTSDYFFILVGVGVFTVVVGISIPLERYRARKIAKELLSLIEKHRE